MRKFIVAVVLAVAVLSSQGVKAAEDNVPKTVQDFISSCKFESVYAGFCMEMIRGIQFMLLANASPKVAEKFRMCASDGVTIGQFSQLFLNWANAHPKKWQYDATGGIVLALVEANPC